MTHTIYPGLEGLAATATDAELEQMHESQRSMIVAQRKAAAATASLDLSGKGRTIELKKTFDEDNPLKVVAKLAPQKRTYAMKQCPHCGYSSAYSHNLREHMHRRHAEVPEGKLCDMGCGRPANHPASLFRFCCVPDGRKCPAVQGRERRPGHRLATVRAK